MTRFRATLVVDYDPAERGSYPEGATPAQMVRLEQSDLSYGELAEIAEQADGRGVTFMVEVVDE